MVLVEVVEGEGGREGGREGGGEEGVEEERYFFDFSEIG